VDHKWHGKFHPDRSNPERENVNLVINSGTLEINGENKSWQFNTNSLSVEIGGLDHDTLYISDPGQPAALLVVRDKHFTEALAREGSIAVKRVLEGGKKTRSQKKLFAIAGWSSLIILFFSFFFTGLGTTAIAALIPVSIDKEIGKAAFPSAVSSMAGQYMPVNDPVVQEAITLIQKRLEAGIKNRKFNYTIEVFESDLVNAVALPGGYIAVFSGLIRKAESPEELAAVLAHEISHAEKRHSVRQLIRQAGIMIGLQLLAGDAQGAIAMIADGAAMLASLDYTRSMESEADEMGAEILLNSEISPNAMATFFEKLLPEKDDNQSNENKEADNEEQGSLLPEWLSTHPDTEKRIKNAQDIAEKHKDAEFTPIKVNWKKVQNRF